MIFDIYVQEEGDEFKDVALDMALEDYEGELYTAHLILDKADGSVTLNSDILWSPSGHMTCSVCRNTPEWVKQMVIRLTPRMHEVMEHGRDVRSFTTSHLPRCCHEDSHTAAAS